MIHVEIEHSGRSRWAVVRVNSDERIVWLIDLDGPLSVTNDAERVCESVYDALGDYRIVYRDTMMNWDEMVHTRGRFDAFRPARDMGIEI